MDLEPVLMCLHGLVAKARDCYCGEIPARNWVISAGNHEIACSNPAGGVFSYRRNSVRIIFT